MKKLILLGCLTVLISAYSFSQIQQNLPLLSNWDDNTLPTAWTGTYNDCWGYVDANGREYAILGAINGTFFFDVTDPLLPVMISYQPGKDSGGVHRDYKTYQHYAYGVCDEGNSSLQIWDLQYLPDSVVKVYDSDQYSMRCHNIFIEDDKLYLASNTLPGFVHHAMDVLSLANPANPTFISTLNGPFSHIHDVFVKNDTAWCSAGYDGLYIYDYTDAANPALIQTITNYPEDGYNHSSWLSDDGNILVFADENWGKGLKIFDVSNLANPQLLSVFRSNLLNIQPPNGADGSIAHNPFIINNKVVISYYHDGIQVFDISDPNLPIQAGYYDTYPANLDYNNYKGAWGVYPFLPSGNIIASDIDNGLFMLDGTGLILNVVNPNQSGNIVVYPNPFRQNFIIDLPENYMGKAEIKISDIAGRIVKSKEFNNENHRLFVEASDLAKGIYIVNISSENFTITSKVLKLE